MSQPDISTLLANWWGDGWSGSLSLASISTAANIIFGANPLYQVSDFLAIYPKFGTQVQGLMVVVPNTLTPGAGYAVNDLLTVIQPDASGGQVKVAAVTAGVPTMYGVTMPGTGYQVTPITNSLGAISIFSGGVGYVVGDVVVVIQPNGSGGMLTVTATGALGTVTGFTVSARGTGYAVQGQLSTAGGHGLGLLVNITNVIVFLGSFTTGGAGAGALVDVTAITPANLLIPAQVLQLYINLASSQLAQARWADAWPVAMAWFVAHYATLYLRSEGNVGSTAGQVASSGLTRGVMVSKSAGNVSASIQVPTGLEDWGAWTETEYGTQLATMAKAIGMGMMYVV